MGQIIGRYTRTKEKKLSLNFFISIFLCIFALAGMCLGEYGHISAFVFSYSVCLI